MKMGNRQMKFTFHEKLVLIILSALLLTGAIILHARRSRPYNEITIVENGVKERLTLEQVERNLKETRKIDINISTAEEITSIPGVGEVLAARIVAYRDKHGNYHYENDLLNVKGIGKKKLEKIREYIRIE